MDKGRTNPKHHKDKERSWQWLFIGPHFDNITWSLIQKWVICKQSQVGFATSFSFQKVNPVWHGTPKRVNEKNQPNKTTGEEGVALQQEPQHLSSSSDHVIVPMKWSWVVKLQTERPKRHEGRIRWQNSTVFWSEQPCSSSWRSSFREVSLTNMETIPYLFIFLRLFGDLKVKR